ncbi:MAG: DUF3575 domain-containing protein [Bacteroidales bacterium]
MKKSIVILIFLLASFTGFAQQYQVEGRGFTYTEKYKPKMNLVKMNLTAIPLNNYSVQYERVLFKRVSVALSYRMMPTKKLPFLSSIQEQIDDPEVNEMLDNFKIGNSAITPEVRFYLGKKGYGRGFYISPFVRFANYEASDLLLNYDDENNQEQSIVFAGSGKSFTYGVMFGAQWSLSKHVVLDWWIAGPHFGNSKFNLDGVSSRVLGPPEQDVLQDFMNDITDEINNLAEIRTTATASVNENGAKLATDGLWGGIRAGISLGIKF